MHIFSPDALPASKLASLPYTPPEATIPQAIDVLGKIGKGLRMCVVQPSVYGVDNEVTIGGVDSFLSKFTSSILLFYCYSITSISVVST
jgi:hypothetical protein